MEIVKDLTNTNYSKGNNREIKYIVIHYVGAVSTARNNAKYFKDTYRGASAHYFVDDNEIVQVVEDKNISWHCGANKYYNGARNTNSIGIEMCCYKNNGKLDVSSKVINKAIELTKELMKKYKIPAENIVRHYDVTHKNCPAPLVIDENRWLDFKNSLIEKPQTTKSITDLAYEVIDGKYGTGEARKKALGSLYDEVQNEVNRILLGNKTTNTKKSNEQIANEVIQGKWGNGSERKKNLEKAGYNYNDIQKLVNQKMS